MHRASPPSRPPPPRSRRPTSSSPYTHRARPHAAGRRRPPGLCARRVRRQPSLAAVPEFRTDALAGVAAVNAELATQWRDDRKWRVDGVLLSTQNEMDPELQARVGHDEALTDSTAVLVAVQGPTQMRNVYCSRPAVGDCVYLGLVWAAGGGTATSGCPFAASTWTWTTCPSGRARFSSGFRASSTARSSTSSSPATSGGGSAAPCASGASWTPTPRPA